MELLPPGESQDGPGAPRKIKRSIQGWGKLLMEEYVHLEQHWFFSLFCFLKMPHNLIKHSRQSALTHALESETQASGKVMDDYLCIAQVRLATNTWSSCLSPLTLPPPSSLPCHQQGSQGCRWFTSIFCFLSMTLKGYLLFWYAW